ncbi:hypothetical protein [Reinekea sp.]|uniref:hypothetical protein n=1 Tax=Reinekea sp. TaxID=1970455 RepID=UPI002A82D13A|nr:hypothetical protein [Reinekea sp.]
MQIKERLARALMIGGRRIGSSYARSMARPGIQSTASPGQASSFLSPQNALVKLKKKRQKALLSIYKVRSS